MHDYELPGWYCLYPLRCTHDRPCFEVQYRFAGMDVLENRNDQDFPWTHRNAELTGGFIGFDNEG